MVPDTKFHSSPHASRFPGVYSKSVRLSVVASGMDNGGNLKKASHYSSTLGLIMCLVFISLLNPATAVMEITAFEYSRKFHKTLELGECCQREIAVNMGNNSYYIEAQKCSLYQKGTVTYVPQETSDSKNVLITSAELIVPYLGLCGGEAASFLGILNSGDCVAIEIASRLTFSDKTVVRAFVGTYQKSYDTLEGISNNVEGMEMYYKDRYFLKDRTYGTFEIVLVQLRFNSVLAAQEAKKIKLATPYMSDYLKLVQSSMGLPRSVMVISLSTATQETYQIQQFKAWERALRYVEILELNIQRVRSQINTNTKQFHLLYRLQPFLADSGFRSTSSNHWEEISMLEIQLRQAINLAKKTSQKCRGNRSKLCRRVRELKRKLITAQAEVHKGRSEWIRMKPEEKISLATNYKANVKSYNSVTKNLAKSVKQMFNKGGKNKKTAQKPNIDNQIPRDIQEQIQGGHGRIRFAASRRRLRNLQSS